MLIAILLLLLPSLSWAQATGWEKEWKDLLAGARKEGRVVVTGDPDPAMRLQVANKFTKKFGITVEYLGGRGSYVAARLRAERRARHYTTDVFSSGLGTITNVLYAEKMLAPLKPVLILPEVVDPSKWKKGKLWFVDPEEKYILRLFNYLTTLFFVNTDYVKPEEFKSMQDLLNPKWRGKIITDDPTISGSGGANAAKMYRLFGPEFIKALYVDQKPMISRNRRQIAEWLARGTYPIAIGASNSQTKRLMAEGFPIAAIRTVSDAPGTLSAGDGLLTLINHAPHPNAASVFINWITSREGLEILSRARMRATTRNDVDESFLPPGEVPRPGVKYFDGMSWEFQKEYIPRVRPRIRKIVGR